MKKLINLRLKSRLLAYILISFTVIYGITLGYISYSLKNNTLNDSKAIIDSNLKASRNLIQNDINQVITATNTIRNIYNDYFSMDIEGKDVLMRNVILGWLKESPALLSTWQIWELKALDPTFEFKNGRERNIALRLGQKLSEKSERIDITNDELSGKYYDARIDNKPNIWDPYYDEVTKELEGILMTSVFAPIQDEQGTFLGMVGIDVSLNDMSKIISSMDPYEGAVSYLVSRNTSIVAHTDNSLVSEKLFDVIGEVSDDYNKGLNLTSEGEYYSFEFTNPQSEVEYYVSYAPVKFNGIETTWTLGIEVPKEVILAKANRIFYSSLLIGLTGLIILYIIVYITAGNIVRPIVKSAEIAREIADGNLKTEIDIDEDQNDEAGDLGRALKDMVENLKNIITEIVDSSVAITSASVELSTSATQLSEGASNQAASSEEISSSMEEMVATIQQNSENSKQTETIALESADGIKESYESSKDTTQSMQEISEKISIIEEIAKQTNILALNAAVEAARAGEQGRGFAVVASEVKKLAERSQKAAVEIIELTQHGVTAAEKSGHQLEAIIPEIEKTSQLVQEITASSYEQQSGAEQVNRAIQELNEVTQQNSGSASIFTNNSEHLTQLAEKLKETISYFKR